MMDAPYHFYETSVGHGLEHDPIRAIVAPRPIGWISTIDAQLNINLAPYSFFNLLSEQPAIVGFSSNGMKDSLRNVAANGEFVVNIVGRPLLDQMNITSLPFPAGTSELLHAGLTPLPSRMVTPPRIAGAPAALECRLTRTVSLDGLGGTATGYTLVLGEVVGVHIDVMHLREGRFDTAAAQIMARCGYRGDYAQVDTLIELNRPDY